MARQECTWDPPQDVTLEDPLWPEKADEGALVKISASRDLGKENAIVSEGEIDGALTKEEDEKGHALREDNILNNAPGSKMALVPSAIGNASAENTLFRAGDKFGSPSGGSSSEGMKVRVLWAVCLRR